MGDDEVVYFEEGFEVEPPKKKREKVESVPFIVKTQPSRWERVERGARKIERDLKKANRGVQKAKKAYGAAQKIYSRKIYAPSSSPVTMGDLTFGPKPKSKQRRQRRNNKITIVLQNQPQKKKRRKKRRKKSEPEWDFSW